MTSKNIRILFSIIFLFAALILLTSLFVRIAVSPFMYDDIGDVPKARYAVVLGASVVRGEPSPTLARRADAAIHLYNMGKVGWILISGDGERSDHDEVTPVQKYLTAAFVPAEDIVLDYSGVDTYSSMYNAKKMFGSDPVIVVTQDFHLPRALFIARQLGLEAYGISAEGEEGITRDYIREIPASIKAIFDLFVGRRDIVAL